MYFLSESSTRFGNLICPTALCISRSRLTSSRGRAALKMQLVCDHWSVILIVLISATSHPSLGESWCLGDQLKRKLPQKTLERVFWLLLPQVSLSPITDRKHVFKYLIYFPPCYIICENVTPSASYISRPKHRYDNRKMSFYIHINTV